MKNCLLSSSKYISRILFYLLAVIGLVLAGCVWIFTLDIILEGTGSGRVSSSPEGIYCEQDCDGEFSWGSEVMLSATPYTGSTFTGWNGGDCGGTEDCLVVIEADTTVTATFTRNVVDTVNLITPYVNQSDMLSVRESFSTVSISPWGFVHDGIDFFPQGDLKPFQAACSGRISRIYVFDEQVTVLLKCNTRYMLQYNFETQLPGTGQEQLDNMTIVEGQLVSQGDIIGYLYAPNGDSHVHFSLFENALAICPESYFDTTSASLILSLIQAQFPNVDAKVCYGADVYPPPFPTPYQNEADMKAINAGFSSENSFSPWNYVHNGIDVYPLGDLKPFQAVCPGTVELAELKQDNITANWQVEVLIRCNDYVYDSNSAGYFIPYSTQYIFETMSPDPVMGQAQQANINVIEGQVLNSGDIIGLLSTNENENAHMHFAVLHLGPPGFLLPETPLCPETYFSPSAKDSVLDLLHVNWPSANLCYEY